MSCVKCSISYPSLWTVWCRLTVFDNKLKACPHLAFEKVFNSFLVTCHKLLNIIEKFVSCLEVTFCVKKQVEFKISYSKCTF